MDTKILSRVQALCSRREYCSADIVRKLTTPSRACASRTAAAGSSAAVLPPLTSDQIQEILSALKKDKFLDDARYARAFVRDKSVLSGWGARKIRCALMAKGLDEQVINQALSSLDEEQVQERMEKVLSVKHKSLKNDPKVREKLIRFGLSRGYAYDELSDCVHHLLTR